MPSTRKNFIDIEKTGNWDGVTQAFKAMGFNIDKAARNGQEAAAKKIILIVKHHIIYQDLPWPALRPSTVKFKGGRTDILLDTWLYYESINYWWKDKTVHAGVKRGLHYPDGKEIANIGAMLERGTKKMPARPVWGPSLEEVGGAKGLRDIVAETIVRKLERLFAGTPAKVTKDWVLSYY